MILANGSCKDQVLSPFILFDTPPFVFPLRFSEACGSVQYAACGGKQYTGCGVVLVEFSDG